MTSRRPTARAVCLLAALAAGAAAPAQAQDAAARQRCNRAGDPRVPAARVALEAEVQGDGAPAQFARACLAHAAGRHDEAAREFERLAAEHPDSAAYRYYVGRAYGVQAQRANLLRQAGLARKVKSAFERAVALDPDYLDAREGLMQYYLQAPGIMGGSEAKAREQAYEVRKRNAYRGGLLYALLSARAKDDAGALRELDALVRAYPDSAGPYWRLGAALERRGERDRARTAYEAALRLEPEHARAQEGLARLR